MIIKNNHVVMTNQIALLLELARIDNCKKELTMELLEKDNLPDDERQKFYDSKEEYFRNKVHSYGYKIIDMYNNYWVYEKDPNAKTPKYEDHFKC